ncbi:MAG TPA: hypothetical protein VKB48_06115 [Candidatus Acidoferrum sp.]|nr:hypothetical protein [Candidatus Acidoferrum sp.]
MPKVDRLFNLLVTVFHLLLDAWRLIRLAFNRTVLRLDAALQIQS